MGIGCEQDTELTETDREKVSWKSQKKKKDWGFWWVIRIEQLEYEKHVGPHSVLKPLSRATR